MNAYAVRSTKDNAVKGLFPNRKEAKVLRNELNGGAWDDKGKHEFVVSRSDEHPHGASGSRAIKRQERQAMRKRSK